MKKTTFLAASGLVLGLGMTLPQMSLAQVGSTTNDDAPRSVGQFSVTNNTGMTIQYQRRWGSEPWRAITLAPGRTETHSHRLDSAGRAPRPHVAFSRVVENNAQAPFRRGGFANQPLSFFNVVVGGYGPGSNPGSPKTYQFVVSPDGGTLLLRSMF
ncbi:MAG TPA: hypothetical protein VG055_31365 [Planctomycetaceae bacterium]|jgi:hypothetical protein|nr:hypothetical protein [Planctomycetaceae bacterium]